jgi:hypothetical protein
MRAGGPIRGLPLLPILLGSILLAPPARAAEGPDAAGAPGPVLVLTFRSVGVSDTTVAVVRDLLAGEIESRGLPVSGREPGMEIAGLEAGGEECDEAECARRLCEERGAGMVVFGTLSKLGEKIIVRARALRMSDPSPFYSDQLPAATEEDLDAVMRRIAEGIAAGRPNSDLATIDSVTKEETVRPRRKEGRGGLGFRAGILWPDGDSYGGADHLTDLHLAWRVEGHRYVVETTTLLGLRWGDGCADWTLLDVFGARLFGLGDVATYAGGGLGLHALHVEQHPSNYVYPADSDHYDSGEGGDATALSADVGVGVVLFHTYSLQIVADARYHYVFENFPEVNDQGAHGLVVTFGTSY